MSLPLIVIRPEPGCAGSVAGGLALGLDTHGYPLFEVTPRAWSMPEGQFDGLLLGSANAVRHAGPGLEELGGMPVHAVGEATAEVVRSHGFTVASVGGGGLQSVLDGIAAPARLLRLAGEDHVQLNASAGIAVETRIVYASEPRPMPPELADTLRNGAVVMLHSAAAARHFAAECERLGVSRDKLYLATLGPRIAVAASEGWAAVRTASVPTEAALLALAADLCHAFPGREGR